MSAPRRVADRQDRQREELLAIRAGLAARAGDLAVLLLQQQPTTKRGQQWRFHPNGSLRLVVSGSRAGAWHDKASDRGGGMLDLIARERGLRLHEAIGWARSWLGMPEPDYATPVTEEERRRREEHLVRAEARRIAAERRDAEQVLRRQQVVARHARVLWDEARPAPASHPYAVAKGVEPVGLRVDADGNLVLPMSDLDGVLWGLQWIAPDGGLAWRTDGWDRPSNKRFMTGARTGGSVLVLGEVDPARPVWFAEGWATGQSLRVCTGAPVVVCWNVSNKATVMRLWRERHPGQVLLDGADNDWEKPLADPPKLNVGVVAALEMRDEVGSLPMVPPFTAADHGLKDWNDFMLTYGPEAVRDIYDRTLAQLAAELDLMLEGFADPADAGFELPCELEV